MIKVSICMLTCCEDSFKFLHVSFINSICDVWVSLERAFREINFEFHGGIRTS